MFGLRQSTRAGTGKARANKFRALAHNGPVQAPHALRGTQYLSTSRLANAQTRARYAQAGAEYVHTGRTCSASTQARHRTCRCRCPVSSLATMIFFFMIYLLIYLAHPPLWIVINYVRAAPPQMPLRKWYNRCTKHFHQTSVIWWKWKVDRVIKPVSHDLVRRIRFWRIKSPEHNFRYLYWTISKNFPNFYLPVREHTRLGGESFFFVFVY